MVISVILSQCALALEITLDSPQEVELEKDFSATISAETEENHDVKVFVHNSQDAKIDRSEYISEIYNDGWQDSYLYIKESFPSQTEYKVKVFKGPGEREICARLRKSGTSAFSTQCEEIRVLGEEKEVSEKEEEEKEKEDEPEKRVIKKVSNSSPQESIKEGSSVELAPIAQQKTEKLTLNSKPLNKEKLKKVIKTPEYQKRNFLIYGFVGFCIIIIILLSLRKL